MTDTGGVITTNAETGVTTLDVPSPQSISRVDQLKSDQQFMQQYMSGDKVAIATMGDAIKHSLPALEPVQTAPAAPEPAQQPQQQQTEYSGEYVSSDDFKLNFSNASGLDLDVMTEANVQVNELIYSLQAPRELAQPVFDRLLSLSKQYGDDPMRDAEERQASLHTQLRASWGEQYQQRMDAVIAALEAHPELDEAIYASGGWGDYWTIDTLSRVALKELR